MYRLRVNKRYYVSDPSKMLIRCLLFVILTSMTGFTPSKDRIGMHHGKAEGTVPGDGNRDEPEALLLQRFHSLEQLEQYVHIEYFQGRPGTLHSPGSKAGVRLTYRAGEREVTAVLASGISEEDFLKVKSGGTWEKIRFGLNHPFVALHRGDLQCIESLGRRRPWIFGKGDVAFYDLAEAMVRHIADEDRTRMRPEDLSDKGYLNTFNHITAQAFMTTIFSETMADFVADVHERFNLKELITGRFTSAQVQDLANGPVDNYIDMINNEWGQELGNQLKEKYRICRHTRWTPFLLQQYLNDHQRYYSWCFRIGFRPFRAEDEVVIRFSEKLNRVLAGK